MIELFKALIIGIIEGVTEWLPISSTGHMILADEFLKLDVSAEFLEMFLVVIQLGAILAVVVLYWNRLFPLSFSRGVHWKTDVLSMWVKVLIACIPAAIVGLLFDDELNALFYNYQTVAIMLILFGILFIIIEKRNKNAVPRVNSIAEMDYKTVLLIGVFQLIAAVFPGTSRSGATIVGALMLGVARSTAAEFTFFLAVPVMAGAGLLKLVKFGFSFTGTELSILLIGMVVAFATSMLIIRFLMNYIRRHDFTAFGWYRIALGVVVLAYFAIAG